MTKSIVPPYIETLQPYKAGKPIDEVKREFGLTRVIKLASNENPLGPSPLSLAAMRECMDSLHLYPNGGMDLRETLAGMYNVRTGNVIVGSGSEGVMLNIIRTFLDESDSVLTTESAFIGFQVLAKSRGVEYQTVPYDEWRYDLPALASRITAKTKLIYLANPNNPTGTFFTRDEFDAFYSRVPDDVLVIFDEAYFEYAEEEPSYPDSMKYRYDNVITLRTFSKIYGLAGVRIGYGFAHERLISQMLKVKLPFEPSSLAQAAALGALRDSDFLHRSREVNRAGMHLLMKELPGLGFHAVPSSANFIMIECSSANDVRDLFEGLLRQGVIVRPLTAFGLPNCVRISIGLEEENLILLEALRKLAPTFSL
jgi:histidinol-phosphate aminotransferase